MPSPPLGPIVYGSDSQWHRKLFCSASYAFPFRICNRVVQFAKLSYSKRLHITQGQIRGVYVTYHECRQEQILPNPIPSNTRSLRPSVQPLEDPVVSRGLPCTLACLSPSLGLQTKRLHQKQGVPGFVVCPTTHLHGHLQLLLQSGICTWRGSRIQVLEAVPRLQGPLALMDLENHNIFFHLPDL